MIRLLPLMISIGFADSLNPSTIVPALYLASGPHPRRQVAQFTFGVFAVYLVGGLAIALGPGELVLSLVPKPGRHLVYVLETIAGVVMIVAAVGLWRYRHRLSRTDAPAFKPGGRSGAWLGATITAVELPTAFPYFAAIATVVGADLSVPRVVFLLVVFNVCFILPLLGILGTLAFAGDDAQRLLVRGRQKLEANWPIVLAVIAMVVGLFVVFLGVTGIGARHHNDFGTLSRRLRRALHLHP